MIHYHGLPITPATAAYRVLQAGHGCVSFLHKQQTEVAIEVAQSWMADNGAFSAWRAGSPIQDWGPFYEWARQCQVTPNCDFAVIPDVIDGDEDENDKLIEACPLPSWFAAPVWHMHEGLPRLARLAANFPRVCIGSSGRFRVTKTGEWWERIAQAMAVVCV